MIDITPELLADVKLLKPGLRRKVYRALQEQEFARCAEDPIYWMDKDRHGGVPYVYTLDPRPMFICNSCDPDKIGEITYNQFNMTNHVIFRHHEPEDVKEEIVRSYFTELPTIRPWTMKGYMPPIIDTWLKNQLVAIEKSRDMIATWLIVTLYCWDTFFHQGRQNLFQSRESSKSLELIKDRALFIYKHQPRWLQKYKIEFIVGQNRAGMLNLPDLNSQIIGFPQGPDQIRQYHPGGIFIDEAAFQEKAGDAYAAIKPAIEAGGRVTLVSSAAPGFFQRVVEDRTED